MTENLYSHYEELYLEELENSPVRTDRTPVRRRHQRNLSSPVKVGVFLVSSHSRSSSNENTSRLVCCEESLEVEEDNWESDEEEFWNEDLTVMDDEEKVSVTLFEGSSFKQDFLRATKEIRKERKSLAILGPEPCTAYCPRCECDVHTEISINKSGFSKKVWNLFGSMSNCCGYSEWFNKLRVHRCPRCQMNLAKLG